MGPRAAATLPEPPVEPAGEPLDSAGFAALIGALGPFEHRPHVAVAVSGGADSLCLALLAHEWAHRRGGTATALTVDHGLRPGSADEAATVGRWLAAFGMPHAVLRWDGVKPSSGVQEAARAARYRLLTGWCRDNGVLHLLVGHHRDDQLETALMRAARGSGPDGLAGMSAIVERPEVRLLRPLLGVPGARLRATLRARGQDWIEDPSNRNLRFARVRLRTALRGGSRPNEIGPAETARARVATETALAGLLGASVTVHPEGWAEIALQAWRTAGRDMARRALVRVLLTVGGADYPPRGHRLDPVLNAVLQDRLGGGCTLAGCRLLPHDQMVIVAREAGRAGPAVSVDGPGAYVWDNRFVVAVAEARVEGLRIAVLGQEGWREVVAAKPEIRVSTLPYAARLSLPALFDLEGVRAVPHLMYGRRGADPDSVRCVSAMFRPRHALAGPGFAQS
ncbi:MAG TPA: tRNA lysidine(34) synthetase TilS [Alphaproteobacteria bacterium]|nr:tRNA lysidine(34) synthetase TilS [Alphaproteobacteria bacterium]